MKIIQNKTGYIISVNSKYICVVGKSLNIYDRNSFKLVCNFSDSKNYSHVEFASDHILISKSSTNSELLYSVYNIGDKNCITRIRIGPLKEPQPSSFILSPDKDIIFDVIVAELSIDERLYKIKIETGSNENVRLGEDVRVIQNMSYNYETHNILIMHDRAAGIFNGELNGLCTVTQVDSYSMACEDVYKRFTPIENGPLLFFENRYILFENMEIIDIITEHVIGKINYPYQRMQHGYFDKAYFSTDLHYLFFIYSQRIIVIDYTKNEIVKEIEDEYCAYAQIIDNNILIGTWKKVYMIDL